MAQTEPGPSGTTWSPVATAAKKAISDVKSIALLLAVFGSVIIAYHSLRVRLGLHEPWLTAVSLVPLVMFSIFYLLPELKEARRKRKIEELGIKGNIQRPGYFRLCPYTENDQSGFVRTDDAVQTAVNWITSTSAHILYLYGHSGVGKSSLINAAIIPRLRGSTPSWTVVQIRLAHSWMDQIKSTLLKPGVIWRQPPTCDSTETFDVIERAERYIREQKGKLLLIFDQFEEVFILLNDAERVECARLLGRLSDRSALPTRVLLSLRAEYLSDLMTLKVPLPTIGFNCLEVRPFTQSAARDFMERSQLDLGPVLAQRVLAEVAEIEDMPDRVRPIVLNMIGLVLSSFKGVLPRGVTPGKLLSGYIFRAISAADIRSSAPKVLRPLLTVLGTKQARSIAELSEQSGLSNNVVSGSLIRLADSGLVRCLDDDRWEISHDFVARLIHPLLQNWRKSLWESARPILMPTALSIWVGSIGIALWVTPSIRESIALATLARAGITVKAGKNFETTQSFYVEVNDENKLGEVLSYFSWLREPDINLSIHRDETDPIRDKDVYSNLVSTFIGWPSLANLTELSLEAKKMQNLVGMPILPRLQRLSLFAWGLESLYGMPVQPSLRTFYLESGIQSGAVHTPLRLTGMPALQQLTYLYLCGVDGELSGLPILPSL